jgi:8-oxo-dGTP diphosphatase
MKLLDSIHDKDFLSAPPPKHANYYERSAVRAVLLDSTGRVFLLHVGLHGYHKLPGGGIDRGEDNFQALARELKEEVGCEAIIIRELGEIIEHREYIATMQTSYCYLAQQVGAKHPNNLEEGEIDEQMSEVLAASIDDAIALLEADTPNNLEGKFIQRRDLAFLREAKASLER